MSWWQVAALGVAGGVIVDALVWITRLRLWWEARRETGEKVAVTRYIDPFADVAAGLTRWLLGGVGALIFRADSAVTAIATGFALPSLLLSFGSLTVRIGRAKALSARPVMSDGRPEISEIEEAARLVETYNHHASRHPDEDGVVA